MSILKPIVSKPAYDPRLRGIAPEDPRQRGLMVGSLFLLLLALSIVLWHDRDFWFPDTQEAETEEPAETAPAAKAPVQQSAPEVKSEPVAKSSRKAVRSAAKPPINSSPGVAPTAQPQPPMVATTTRTVLPPLEVEVVAGDTHKVIRPGSNSMHVDLQPGTTPSPATDASNTETAASVTHHAAENVRMSADATAVVTSPVKPNYPLLARQMKVQGSVILQALIGKDGSIQNLRVLSGPRILASAAEDAVRQWHFKPHFEGNEAVETQAKITVNFTISTN